MAGPVFSPLWVGHYGLDGRDSGDLVRQGERRLADDPADAEGWALIARAAHLKRNTPFAAACLERAVKLGHADPGLRVYLARLCCELGDPLRARGWLAGAPDDLDGAAHAAGVVALGLRDPDGARSAFEAEAAAGGAHAEPARWGADWLAAARSPLPIGPDETVIAVLGYASPDPAVCSANLGDYIQTLAMLRHLARLSGVAWTASDPALLETLHALEARVDEGETIAVGAAALRLEAVDRDAPWPAGERLAGAKAWALVYGWHYHRAFLAWGPFPAPPGLEPLVVSFHLATPEMLTPELIEWLKGAAPIGCRDWTTVGWLLNQGVEAFFSGCVTTTWPVAQAGARAGRWWVDAAGEPPPGAVLASHADETLRAARLADALRQSALRVDAYGGAAAVITGRLHVYLPCRALGTPVEFRPTGAADPRYEGLVGLPEPEFRAMAARLSGLIGAVLGRIASGAEVDEVRAYWRTLTAADVEASRARFADEAPALSRPPPPHAPAPTPGPAGVHIALAVEPESLRPALVALRSVLAHTRGPTSIILVVRSLDAAALARLRRAANGAVVEIVEPEEGADPALDPFALAHWAPTADRVLWLSGAVVAQADLAALMAWPMGDFAAAARPGPVAWRTTLGLAVEAHAAGLDAARAADLRRFAAAGADLAAPFFEGGVRVLSLVALRAAGVREAAETTVARFGAGEALAMNLALAGRIAPLPWTWSADPAFELFDEARLIHWAVHPVPWLLDRAPLLADRWLAYEEVPGEEAPRMDDAEDSVAYPLCPPFTPRGPAGWIGRLTEAAAALPRERQEVLVLREDGRRLGPGGAMEADIAALGAGRHAVWPNVACFSSSDNSDPNLNGRAYALTLRSAPAEATDPYTEDGAPPLWLAPAAPVRCAIIGAGARGQAFAARLAALEGVELAWLVDPDPARLAAAASAASGESPRLAADAAQALTDPDVSAVFVTAPDHWHRPLAVAAFEAGKHLFLEKPVATTLADGQAIMQAWQTGGRVLQLGYVLRETPFYQAVRRLVLEGRLGRIHTINLTDHLGVEHGASFMRRWHRDSARSGGLMVHKGCHDLDLACWLLGARPVRVASFGGAEVFSRPAPAPFCSVCPERQTCPYEDHGAYEARTPAERADSAAFGLDICVFGAGHDIVDNQVVAFELTDGARGSFSLAMQNPPGSRRVITLMGEAGRLDGDFHAGRFEAVFNDGAPPVAWSVDNLPATGHGGGDQRALQAFLDACLGRRPPELTDPKDAMRGLVFALAAEEARLSGAVVTLERS